MQKCEKCNGSGKFRYREWVEETCLACDGSGIQMTEVVPVEEKKEIFCEQCGERVSGVSELWMHYGECPKGKPIYPSPLPVEQHINYSLSAFNSLIAGDISPKDMPIEAINEIQNLLTKDQPIKKLVDVKTAEEILLSKFNCKKKYDLMTQHFIGLTVINGFLEAMEEYAAQTKSALESDKKEDEETTLLKKIMEYSKKYEISVQFWPDQQAVFIAKDGVDLESYGGRLKQSLRAAVKYLNRINRKSLNH